MIYEYYFRPFCFTGNFGPIDYLLDLLPKNHISVVFSLEDLFSHGSTGEPLYLSSRLCAGGDIAS